MDKKRKEYCKNACGMGEHAWFKTAFIHIHGQRVNVGWFYGADRLI
jgi:hypothetical protein